MYSVFSILGIILSLLFFLNIKPASEVFCRILCGFAVLLALNSLQMPFSAVVVGVNLITALTVGIFGAPGVALIYALTIFI